MDRGVSPKSGRYLSFNVAGWRTVLLAVYPEEGLGVLKIYCFENLNKKHTFPYFGLIRVHTRSPHTGAFRVDSIEPAKHMAPGHHETYQVRDT